MRELARYVLESHVEDAGQKWNGILGIVQEWLVGKGYGGQPDFSLRSGRPATLELAEVDCFVGNLSSWKLLEEIDGGFFETTLHAAVEGQDVRIACTIAAGHGNNRIAPLPVEARCPNVIGNLLDSGRWYLGPTPTARTSLTVSGRQGGETLVDVLTQPERTLPLVVVSTNLGLVLHPDLPARLARDLTALALVTVVDDDASWYLTSTFGKSLSCFSGAVRLYWPGFGPSDSVFKHPLWTAQRLLEGKPSVSEAIEAICDTLRRRLMAVSIAALAEPPMIAKIRHVDAAERAAAARQQMNDDADYQQLANSYADENAALRTNIDKLEEQLRAVRSQLYRLQTEAAWADAADDLQPDAAVPPATVEEAVAKARLLFAGTLVFGDDVERSVAELAPHAGPPDKVFGYLQALSELSHARRNGPLGQSTVQWLSDRNVEVSTESDTVKRSRAEMSRRVWHDGANSRQFEMHLKPNESTHPGQCVRIYFDWDEPSQQIVVGWVGRHP